MPISLNSITGKNNGSSGFHVKQGSGIAPRRRGGRRVNEVVINPANLVRCQLSGFHDPQIHKKFVEIIHSEVGYQYFEGTPRRVPGHRALFLRFGESIGIPAFELERCERENDFLPMTMLA